MYLEEETIRKILAKCGITGYEKIFISCRYRKLKYDGGLFLEGCLGDREFIPAIFST